MGIKEQGRAILATAWKEIREGLRYPLSLIFSGATIFAFSMLGELFGFLAGTRHSAILLELTGISDVVAYMAMGLFVWVYMAIVISDLGWGIMHERLRGTLEQIFISPMSRFSYFLGKIINDMFFACVFILPVAAVIIYIEGISLSVNWGAFAVVLLVATVSFFGFGFMLAALVLIARRVGQLFSFLQMMMLGLCDVLIPIESFPLWLRIIAMCIPLTFASRLIRKTCLLGLPLFAPSVMGDLLALIVESAVYLVVGVLIYRKAEDWARYAGTLRAY